MQKKYHIMFWFNQDLRLECFKYAKNEVEALILSMGELGDDYWITDPGFRIEIELA
jgi:hypothetical protein